MKSLDVHYTSHIPTNCRNGFVTDRSTLTFVHVDSQEKPTLSTAAQTPVCCGEFMFLLWSWNGSKSRPEYWRTNAKFLFNVVTRFLWSTVITQNQNHWATWCVYDFHDLAHIFSTVSGVATSVGQQEHSASLMLMQPQQESVKCFFTNEIYGAECP